MKEDITKMPAPKKRKRTANKTIGPKIMPQNQRAALVRRLEECIEQRNAFEKRLKVVSKRTSWKARELQAQLKKQIEELGAQIVHITWNLNPPGKW